MKKEKNISFGDNLKRARLEKGLTQEQLGQLVGLSRRMIIHYEKHATHPSTDKIAALAQALGIKIEVLIKGTSSLKNSASVDPKFARKLEKAKTLPDDDQKLLATMIDGMLKKNK